MNKGVLAAVLALLVGGVVIWLGLPAAESAAEPETPPAGMPRAEAAADDPLLTAGVAEIASPIDPIDVPSRRTASRIPTFGSRGTLRLYARTPDGGHAMALFAELGAKQALFEGVDVPASVQHADDVERITGDRQLRRRLKGLGSADFPDVLPGVPCTARFVDRSGRELGRAEVAALEEGETRVVDVWLAVRPIPLRAHVVDLEGQDVTDAVVEMGPGGRSADFLESERTDIDGWVNLGFVAPGTIGLRVLLFGSAVFDERLVSVPADGRLELLVSRGRVITVRCVDPDGKSVSADSVSVIVKEGASERSIELVPRTASGRFVWQADAVPPGSFRIRALIQTGIVSLWSGSDTTDLVVPPRVVVDVTWNESVPAWADAVWVYNADHETSSRWIQPAERQSRHLQLALLPGAYKVALSGHPKLTKDVEWATSYGQVAVEAGTAATVRLSEP